MEHEKLLEHASKFLLAPVYAIFEIATAVLPGLLFFSLLMLNGVTFPSALVQSAFLGYKTRICLGILLAYITGRILRIPPLLVGDFVFRKVTDDAKTKQGPFIEKFVIGALAMPKVFAKVHPIDMLVVFMTDVVLSSTTGTAFIIAGLISGSGYLRVTELSVGVIVFAYAVRQVSKFGGIFVFLVGALADLPTVIGTLPKLRAAIQSLQSQQANPAAGAAPAAPPAPPAAARGSDPAA